MGLWKAYAWDCGKLSKKGNFDMVALGIETLRSRFFGISHEPQMPRSDVTSALLLGLLFEVHVCMARPCSRGK